MKHMLMAIMAVAVAVTFSAPAFAEGPKEGGKDKEKDRDNGGGTGKKQEAVDLVLETIDDLVDERGVEETLWGSMVKQAIKRRKPGFSESYYGYRSFNQLLEELDHPLRSLSLHGQPIIQIPLHYEVAALVDVNVPRKMIAAPCQEHVVSTPILVH